MWAEDRTGRVGSANLRTVSERYDAVVVGSGPNGLAAGIRLLQAGRSVLILEANAEPGGGARSAALTLPGFVHDVCSSVHPLGVASPYFQKLPLARYGLVWRHTRFAMAHPGEGQDAAVLSQDLDDTVASLGEDGARYRRHMAPLVAAWPSIKGDVLGPLGFPRRPVAMGRFGMVALRSAAGVARSWFRGEAARRFWAGLAAHGGPPLTWRGTSAAALVLGLCGHAEGWPVPEGGAGRLIAALLGHYRELGGQLRTQAVVRRLSDLPAHRVALLSVTPRQLAEMADPELPRRTRRALARRRFGPSVCKVDWALSGPIPWQAQACRETMTVHLGRSLDQILRSEARPFVTPGGPLAAPYVLLTQPTVGDPSRAPAGQHTAWAYCHVPWESDEDATEVIEAEIEQHAPGFSDLILARHTRTAPALAAYNPTYVGGDIAGGTASLWQMVVRPALTLDPYGTPLPHVFLCSSSTPPGPAVHGLCGLGAAERALAYLASQGA